MKTKVAALKFIETTLAVHEALYTW